MDEVLIEQRLSCLYNTNLHLRLRNKTAWDCLKISFCRWFERTTLWTSWAAGRPSDSPPSAARSPPGIVLYSDPSVSQSVFTITEKAPTRAFSWLKAPTSAFTFKTLLRHYAKRVLTPRSLNVKLGPRHNYHKRRAAIRHYANQTARPL